MIDSGVLIITIFIFYKKPMKANIVSTPKRSIIIKNKNDYFVRKNKPIAANTNNGIIGMAVALK